MDNQLGKNLQNLRVMRGETLKIMAENLGCVRSTISQYESGNRKPDPETLKRLAKYFGKTVDELLYEDLSLLEKYPTKYISSSEVMEKYSQIMPLFFTEELMENSSFAKAYNLCRRVVRAFSEGDVLRGSIITDIFEGYLYALEEVERQEIIADLLWCIFLWWGQIADTKEMLRLQNKLLSKRLELGEIVRIQQNESREVEDKKAAFIADFDILITDAIRILKSEKEWSDLGDYYLALRYMYGIIDTGYSKEMNLAMGIQLMISYGQLENKYALSFFNAVTE